MNFLLRCLDRVVQLNRRHIQEAYEIFAFLDALVKEYNFDNERVWDLSETGCIRTTAKFSLYSMDTALPYVAKSPNPSLQPQRHGVRTTRPYVGKDPTA